LDYPTNTQKCVLPCTALSVVKILETCPGVYDTSQPMGKHMQGEIVTVINRSEIVGRPLAAMLANDGADVYSVDIDSIYLFRGGRLHMVENETVEGLVRKVCWCYLLLLLFIVINSYQLLFIGYVF
jgi:methylenetetrahydrofolate dehydrogenase (NAD+)